MIREYECEDCGMRCSGGPRATRCREHARARRLARQRDVYAVDPRKSEHIRAWNLRKRFNMSYEEFVELHAAQSGQCAACSKLIPLRGRETHVDHDHSTGIVRGLLCFHCNSALGQLADSPKRIRQLLTYIERQGPGGGVVGVRPGGGEALSGTQL